MAPTYKLSYFNFSGLGEPIRFLLHYGNIHFEDKRFNAKEFVQDIKPNTPAGQVPTLELENGKVLFQSIPICRYLGKKLGLSGDNDLENWEIDAVADTLNDLRLKIALWKYNTNSTEQKRLKEDLDNKVLPFYLPLLESWAKKGNGYLANGKLSWVDFYFAGVIDYLNYFMEQDLLESYPSLQAVKKNVFSLPSVREYVATRPIDDLKNI
ncbi:glutathione S-transferase-like [Anthonomus grandis grandis]|uniref:glutathione S-transferase-like n=1 Tax=Anthonomus grandis grandis TaxID=2921223 RepID=UPI0021656296|nr:glutathione S-transferase-like [Anthonomus grandis grandis]